MRLIYTALLCSTLLVLYTPSAALRANPQSPCASLCGNISSTTGDEISCSDAAYSDTSVGQQFEACIACEINSTSIDPGTGSTDLQWLLYNLRYTMSWCLWGYPNNTDVADVPCLTNPACGTFEINVEYNSLSSSSGAYDYCSNLTVSREGGCTSCLQELSTEYYLSNFFTLIIAGCQQTPTSGKTLSISGNPFSTTAVQITTPIASSAASVHNNLSLGAKVGIAAGAIVFLLFITGFTIVCCGKRRRRRVLAEENRFRQTTFTGPLGGLTNWQQQNHPERRLTEESPATADHRLWQQGWEQGSEQNFSPYTSQYNSPVSANDALGEHRGWHGPAISAVVEQKEKEIEMQRLGLGREMAQDAESRGFTVHQTPIIRPPVPIAREPSKEKEAFPNGF